jgi:tRNA_anti-like
VALQRLGRGARGTRSDPGVVAGFRYQNPRPDACDTRCRPSICSPDPRELVGLFKRETSVQAQKQADAFYGKWIRVSGVISDVGAWSGFSSQVTIYYRKADLTSFPVFMMFRDREYVENRLATLRKGDTITVQGEIERIDSVSVQLTNCELVDS